MRYLVPSIFGLNITDMPSQRGRQPAIHMMSPCRGWIICGLWERQPQPGRARSLREHFLLLLVREESKVDGIENWPRNFSKNSQYTY